MAGSFSHTLNSMFAAQLDARTKEIHDAVFNATPLMAWLESIKKPQVGSERFWLPIEYDTNSTVGMIGKGGSVDLSDSDPFSAAYYSKLTIAGNVTSFRDDAATNKGEGFVFDLIEGKVKNLKKSIRKELESQVTANSLVAGNITPLSTIVESTAEASQSTTVGGLSRSTYSWWRNSSKDMGGRATATYIVDDFQDGWYEVFKIDEMSPDVIILDGTTYKDYENYALDAKQFVNTKMGDYSFTTLAYKGIPFIPVAHANFDTAGDRRAYFITSDSISFFYDPDLWWAWTDWKEPDDRPFDKVKQVVCSCNLGIANPRLNHVLFDIGEAA